LPRQTDSPPIWSASKLGYVCDGSSWYVDTSANAENASGAREIATVHAENQRLACSRVTCALAGASEFVRLAHFRAKVVAFRWTRLAVADPKRSFHTLRCNVGYQLLTAIC